jgi:hypothetical protein
MPTAAGTGGACGVEWGWKDTAVQLCSGGAFRGGRAATS